MLKWVSLEIDLLIVRSLIRVHRSLKVQFRRLSSTRNTLINILLFILLYYIQI